MNTREALLQILGAILLGWGIGAILSAVVFTSEAAQLYLADLLHPLR